LLKDIAQRWADRRSLTLAQRQLAGLSQAEAEATLQKITFDAIDVSFDAIADPAERRYFMDLPTSFVLPEAAVDRLRALGGRLLRESSAFQKLMRQIREVNEASQ